MTISISQLRESLRDAFMRAVERHQPVLVERHGELAALVGVEDLDRLLAGFEFRPEVFLEEGAVTFWLPEFALYGRGTTYEEAQEDLLVEVRVYVDDYLTESDVYLRSPNRARHFPHVVRAVVADARGRLFDTLFAPPAGETQAAAEQRAATAV